MSSTARPSEPYSALAAGYDVVMAHVDYEEWAEYVLELIDRHAPQAQTIIELGCGTGSLALEIIDLTREEARITCLATDASAQMIRVAEAKAQMLEAGEERLRFEVADFLEMEPSGTFDVVLLLYDGLNYLLEEGEVKKLLQTVAGLLSPGGIAIIDQSTPANSLNNADYFGDEGEAEGFAYIRRSHYEPDLKQHITEFDLVVDGERYLERHVQRAYTLEEVRSLIDRSPLSVETAYDGFSLDFADDQTERVHWVLRRSGG